MAPEFGKPIHQLPLIPADILKKHRVNEQLDTRFRSAARLLQALWREDRDLPIGSYVNEDGKRRKLGSRISESFFGVTGERCCHHHAHPSFCCRPRVKRLAPHGSPKPLEPARERFEVDRGRDANHPAPPAHLYTGRASHEETLG